MLSKSPSSAFCVVMALSKEEIRVAAESLHRAEKTRTQIRQFSLEYPAITVEDAYAIQKNWIEIKTAEGRTVRGHKIGLTSKAMQSALNIDEPDSGILSCRRTVSSPRAWKRNSPSSSAAALPDPAAHCSRRRGKFTTPSPTTRRMPASCSADG